MTSITPGYHDAFVHSIDLTEASTGTEQIAIQCSFPDFGDEKLTWFGTFSNDKATNWTADCLTLAGYDPWADQWARLPQVTVGAETPLKGRKVRAKVVIEEYKGQENTKLKTFVDPDGGSLKKIDDGKKNQLMDRLKAARQLSEDERFGGSGTPATAGAPAAAGLIEPDDTPF